MNQIINLEGCVVRDEKGVALAVIHEGDAGLVVRRTPACTYGDYFYILSYLIDLGFILE